MSTSSFPFFALSREIRDEIYFYILSDSPQGQNSTLPTGKNVTVFTCRDEALDAFRFHLLLICEVSRATRHEALAVLYSAVHLKIDSLKSLS